MTFARSRFRPFLLPALAAALLILQSPAFADAASTSEAPTDSRELSRVVVRHSERTATYIQVAPRPPQPAALRSAPATPAPVFASPEEIAREARLSAKRHGLLMLSATIHPGPAPLTELSWTQEGRTWRAVSNIDFRLLQPLSEIETPETFHSLFFFPGLASPGDAPPPRPAALPPSPAAYQLVSTPGQPALPPADTLAALDALHRHHDSHRAELLAAREAREAAEALAEMEARRARLAPPAPLVVRFAPPAAAVVPHAEPAHPARR